MTDPTQIAELDRSIADNTKLVELAKSLDRLESNRDFRKIVTDGYFAQEAIRLVHLKADPAMQTPDKQASVLRQIDAIGILSDYLRTIRLQGETARKGVEDAETDRAELLAGD